MLREIDFLLKICDWFLASFACGVKLLELWSKYRLSVLESRASLNCIIIVLNMHHSTSIVLLHNHCESHGWPRMQYGGPPKVTRNRKHVQDRIYIILRQLCAKEWSRNVSFVVTWSRLCLKVLSAWHLNVSLLREAAWVQLNFYYKIVPMIHHQVDGNVADNRQSVVRLLELGCQHGRRKDFFRGGGSRGFYQNFFQGWPKVVKFVFYHSKLKKQPFLLIISNFRGAGPPLPPLRRPWLSM